MSSEATSPPRTKPRPKWLRWESFHKLRDLLKETAPSKHEMSLRLQTMERDVILPVKGAFLLVLFYYFYLQHWYEPNEAIVLPRSVAIQSFKQFYLIYVVVNVFVAVVLWNGHRLSRLAVQWVIFSSNFLDWLFVAALTYITGGVDSLVFWLFPGLIVRNALSSPRARQQLVLNGSVILCYLAASLLDVAYPDEMLDFGSYSAPANVHQGWSALWHIFDSMGQPRSLEMEELSRGAIENPTQPILIRVLVLMLWGTWCYGLQVLLEKQRRASEESKEAAARQEQLRSAGRLAAEIAHQIKNPLGIINTVAFSLQQAGKKNRALDPQQLEIIRSEVARADSIITRLMGYAQLAEGRVERLNVAEEVGRALEEVFPPGAQYTTRLVKRVEPNLPALLMQRAHLSQILVNLLLNAREAMAGAGQLEITAHSESEEAVLLTISDHGPGLQPDHVERIFEPYFSSKERGTGLGLSIVRHNIEIYGGSVRVESELGKGARFILHFPTRTFMKLKT